MPHLARTSADNPDFQRLVSLLDQELWKRYDLVQAQYAQHNTIEKNRTVVVAYYGIEAVGCGCFKKYGANVEEIKRMFVKPEERGKSVARNILMELCKWADELGFEKVILETGNKQPEAIGLYQRAGFRIVENYPPYVGMELSICMERSLNSSRQ